MCKQTVFCGVCGFSPGADAEPVSLQLRALSLKAHLRRSLFAVGPGRDYSQRVPGPVGALAHWQGWHTKRRAVPSPESLEGSAVVGTEWVLKELSSSLTLMESFMGLSASQMI